MLILLIHEHSMWFKKYLRVKKHSGSDRNATYIALASVPHPGPVESESWGYEAQASTVLKHHPRGGPMCSWAWKPRPQAMPLRGWPSEQPHGQHWGWQKGRVECVVNVWEVGRFGVNLASWFWINLHQSHALRMSGVAQRSPWRDSSATQGCDPHSHLTPHHCRGS